MGDTKVCGPKIRALLKTASHFSGKGVVSETVSEQSVGRPRATSAASAIERKDLLVQGYTFRISLGFVFFLRVGFRIDEFDINRTVMATFWPWLTPFSDQEMTTFQIVPFLLGSRGGQGVSGEAD